jgi:hypothetical protein
MILLTPANVFRYMCDRGLSSHQEVVNREFRVFDLSRRNTAFRVSCRSRPDYVVKQIKDWGWKSGPDYETEFEWYRLARQHSAFTPLASFLANCRRLDEVNGIVILELPRHYEGLDEHFGRLGRFSVPVAKMLGETLGLFHHTLSRDALKEVESHLPDVMPLGPTILLQQDIPVDPESPARAELYQFVFSNPVFRETFASRSASWQSDVLINCDMKFAHCILTTSPTSEVSSPPERPAGAHLHFIDWELSGFGDACWDIGAIFQEYLRHWLLSIPSRPNDSYEAYADHARYPLDETQASIAAFWRSYAEAVGVSGEMAERMIDRTVYCTAAWLIQMAYQSLLNIKTMHEAAHRMAALSLRILNAPSKARLELLGV